MGTTEVAQAVEMVRRAGLIPTRQRVTVASLLVADPDPAVTLDEVRERARDQGFELSSETLRTTLAELRQACVAKAGLPKAGDGAGPPRDVAWAARILQAMANPHRLSVLRELAAGERCVSDLLAVVSIQQSAMSQHLARLRADGLVRARRASVRIYYSLAGEHVAAVLRSLGQAPGGSVPALSARVA